MITTGKQIPLFRAILECQNTLEKLEMKFYFIGGLAVLRWGQLRMTQDIGITLLCGKGVKRDNCKTGKNIQIIHHLLMRQALCRNL